MRHPDFTALPIILPMGEYIVKMDGPEGRMTSDGKPYITMKCTILDELYKGRTVWHTHWFAIPGLPNDSDEIDAWKPIKAKVSISMHRHDELEWNVCNFLEKLGDIE